MQIVLKPLVQQKLDELFVALIEEDYFSDVDNALAYLNYLQQLIAALPLHKHYHTKDSKNGHYYASYKANRRTTWFVLFDTEDEAYLIKNITNNHTSDYPNFIM